MSQTILVLSLIFILFVNLSITAPQKKIVKNKKIITDSDNTSDETQEKELTKSEQKYQEVLELSKKFENAVIKFDNLNDFHKYVTKPDRDYIMVMYFTSQTCNICNQMEVEFDKVSGFYEVQGQQYVTQNEKTGKDQLPVIFGKMYFDNDIKEGFQYFGLKSVPYVIILTPQYSEAKGEEKKKIFEANSWFISHTDGTVNSQKILEFINKRTDRNVIHIIPLSEKIQFLFYTISVIVLLLILIYFFYNVLIQPTVWFIVSMIIYTTCCTGFIYNYIHDVPMIQNGQWYTKEQRQQLGLESYVMSISIGFAGLLFIFWNKAQKYIYDQSQFVQRLFYISVFMGVTLVMFFIEDIYKQKGWYNPLFYPPSNYKKGSYLKDQGNTI